MCVFSDTKGGGQRKHLSHALPTTMLPDLLPLPQGWRP